MNITGIITKIGDTIQVTDTFKKRELILQYTSDNKYFEYIKFEAFKDKTELLDKFNEGDNVELFFNIKGREWKDNTGKVSYYNTLSIYNIDHNGIKINKTVNDDGLPF